MKKFILYISTLVLLVMSVMPANAETYYGMDVSDYQGDINWAEVAADGIEFAMIKATEGTDLTESYFYDNVSEANANGIPAGAYHFARFTSASSAEAEADYFLSVIESTEITYAVALDLEVNEGGLDAASLSQAALAFCNKVSAAGYTILIYSSQNFFQTSLDTSQLTDYGFWVARYSSEAPVIDHVMWQYTSTGSVSGIAGNVDENYAYEDFAGSSGGNGGASSGNDNSSSGNDGSTGAPVNTVAAGIQQTLNIRYETGLIVDGIIGRLTKRAMVTGVQTELNVQFNRGLAVDGIYGPRTRAAFINVKYGARGNLTYLIQAALFERGYDTGGVDGIYGPKTSQAIKSFQANQGLAVDGIVGIRTANALFNQ